MADAKAQALIKQLEASPGFPALEKELMDAGTRLEKFLHGKSLTNGQDHKNTIDGVAFDMEGLLRRTGSDETKLKEAVKMEVTKIENARHASGRGSLEDQAHAVAMVDIAEMKPTYLPLQNTPAVASNPSFKGQGRQ